MTEEKTPTPESKPEGTPQGQVGAAGEGQAPEAAPGGEAKAEPKTYDVSGQQVTGAQLHDSYKNLQSHSTKVDQELAEFRKENEALKADQPPKPPEGQPEPAAPDPEALNQVVEALVPALEKAGFAKGDVVTQDDLKLQTLVSGNSKLQGKEQEIRDLAALPHNKDKAYADIVDHYNLDGSNKLAKAKGGDPVGDPSTPAENTSEKLMGDDGTKPFDPVAFRKAKSEGRVKVTAQV